MKLMLRHVEQTVAIALFFTATSAQGVTVFNDGGTHTINYVVNDDVQVVNNSRLNIEGHAEVRGTGTTVPLPPIVYQRGSVVTLGGETSYFPEINTVKVTGNARIVPGGDQLGIAVAPSARADVRVSGDAYVGGGIASPGSTMSGGGFADKRLSLSGNSLVDGDVAWGGYITISDNAIVNGGIYDEYAHFQLDMNGGQVRDAVVMSSAGEFVVNMRGGSMLKGLECSPASYCVVDIRGGAVGPGDRSISLEPPHAIQSVDSVLNFTMSGGQIDGGISSVGNVPDDVEIFGGQINAIPDRWLLHGDTTFWGEPWGFSEFSIYGGQFGYLEQGRGWLFDGYTNLNVYGWGLTFADGRLTGYLSDGSWLDTALLFGDNWRGAFRIIDYDRSVPEPGTFALLSLGLLGIGVTARRRQH